MGQKRIVIILVIAALVGLGYLGYTRYLTPKPEPTPELPIPEEVTEVVPASGEVLPAKWAELAFEVSGRVEEVAVEVGDEVEAGQLLARLDAIDLEHAVAQAEAALKVAEAQLAQVKAGAREEEIEEAEEGLATALANLDAAQAELARLKAGTRAEKIEAAKAEMEKAAKVVEHAQMEYDRFAWRLGFGASPQAKALHLATLDYQIAEARYQEMVNGPTEEEIAAAEAGVDAAKAQVGQARARLKLLRAGASEEEIAVAQAGVEEAKAALDRARAALDDTRLAAPFDGTVTRVDLREGEMVAAGQPVITMGDLSYLRVETTDLNEVDVAKIEVGQKVDLTFDALPERKLTGRVTKIAPMATLKEGGTNYTVTIEFEETDSRLRWGMTAFVDIIVED